MKRNFILTVAVASMLAALTVRAASPADATEPASALTPRMEAALRQLGSGSYAERQHAVAAIQQSMADQMRQMLAVDDPEARARLGGLLEFDDALVKWAMEALKLPVDERASQLAWGLKPDNFPIIAKIYSTNTQARAAGARELGKIPGPEASSLLARLIVDDQREVYLAAMEAVWDRPATPAVVDALWNRAVEAVQAYRDVGGVIPQTGLQFRGQPLSAIFAGNYFSLSRIQDNGLATDVLIQLNGPLVGRKVTDFLEQVEKGQGGAPPDPQSTSYQQPLANVCRIVEAGKYREAVPLLVKLATTKTVKSVSITVNRTPLYYSNRTGALAVALKLLKEDPADYKIQRVSGLAVWVTGSATEEDEAVGKLEELWNKHKNEYVGAVATQPDAQPAAGSRPGF